MRLQTHVSPLDVKGKFEEIYPPYEAACNGCSQGIIETTEIFYPAFVEWERCLINNLWFENINICALYKLLASDNKPIGSAKAKINNYNLWCLDNKITVIEDILDLFTETLYNNRDEMKLRHVNKRRFLFQIAMQVRYFLFIKIRKLNQFIKRDLAYCENSIYFNTIDNYETTYYDKFHISSVLENDWNFYLFLNIIEGHSIIERAKILQMNKMRLKKEEEPIWESLNQMQLNSFKV